MMRPARFADVPRLAALVAEQHAASKYAGWVNIDLDRTKKMLAQMVQRHGGTHEGGAFVQVIEQDGGIVAFVAGILDRVYGVGDQLRANDMFLVAGAGAPVTAARRMLDAYVDWAESVPDCAEITLSWTDAMPTAPRMGGVYERMGFRELGRIYVREPRRAAKEAA
jgi:hypothetical protein